MGPRREPVETKWKRHGLKVARGYAIWQHAACGWWKAASVFCCPGLDESAKYPLSLPSILDDKCWSRGNLGLGFRFFFPKGSATKNTFQSVHFVLRRPVTRVTYDYGAAPHLYHWVRHHLNASYDELRLGHYATNPISGNFEGLLERETQQFLCPSRPPDSFHHRHPPKAFLANTQP